MAEASADDRIRELATTIVRDPEFRRLLENLIELKAGGGRNWAGTLLAVSDDILEERDFIREHDAIERRTSFRAIKGGK